ncbi:YqcC family protein [Apirhabdus apintestini]|uniref:YqcC family protein n=1 Tax=Erwinia sp. HR93 TaxID=3094840 RepID=UPI002ADEAE2D|nr:YqcC family protein [Erwinia sp. HR93]MEA1064149.1 YqcC family protein [Erwinia sp. HR93]WPM84310.1 YqcC family protein [Enterobacteriaceae bacterium CA-0114]
MNRHNEVRQRLLHVEHVLRERQLWQGEAPGIEALNSDQPFCMDTLTPHEWLQWVLLPRMHALLDGDRPLPVAFAVSPYFEMALDVSNPEREAILEALQELDALFDGENP